MRVSLPVTAGRGRIHAALAALGAIAILVVCAGAMAPQAHASFTLNKCEGAEIEGEGSSLQKLAQANWISQIFDTSIYGGCGASAPKVKFTTASSGCGLDSMGGGGAASSCVFTKTQAEWEKPGYRDGKVRFGAADFAPTPEEEKNMDNGPTGAGTAGSGEVHVIPVAGAAITIVVHFPAGCVLKSPGTGTPASGVGTVNNDASTGGVNDPTGVASGDLYSNQTVRVHITDQKLEEIWQGHVTEWGQIVPEADFIAEGAHEAGKAPSVCVKEPIIRIVRQDTSGTSYNFKHFLALLPSFNSEGGAKLWSASSSQVGNTNTAWPLSSASDVGVPPSVETASGAHPNECNSTIGPKHICHSLEGSGGSLSNAVIATSGSIGYLDLATAREKGYYMTPNSTGAPGESGFEETKNDRLYWVPLEPVAPPASESGVGTPDSGVFTEPTAEAKSHFNGSFETKGANCAGADYRGYPSAAESPGGDVTLGDWSKAIATGGTAEAIAHAPTTAYPVCALTYDLAFDDDASVFGNTPEEEKMARTVFDYLSSVVSSAGQFDLPQFDYAALPNQIVEGAQKGIATINWNKSAGSTGVKEEKKEEVKSSTGGGTTPGGSTAVTPPSNAFSIASAKVKSKKIALSLILPGAGKVQVKATGGGVTVASASASVSGGNGTVTLSVSKAALSKLAKVKGHKLSVKIVVTFTPTGGSAASKSKTLTITQAAVAPAKKAKAKKKKKK